jgi:hypothetical protein
VIVARAQFITGGARNEKPECLPQRVSLALAHPGGRSRWRRGQIIQPDQPNPQPRTGGVPAAACRRCSEPIESGDFCDDDCQELWECERILRVAAEIKAREEQPVVNASLSVPKPVPGFCLYCLGRLANGGSWCGEECKAGWLRIMPPAQAWAGVHAMPSLSKLYGRRTTWRPGRIYRSPGD